MYSIEISTPSGAVDGDNFIYRKYFDTYEGAIIMGWDGYLGRWPMGKTGDWECCLSEESWIW